MKTKLAYILAASVSLVAIPLLLAQSVPSSVPPTTIPTPGDPVPDAPPARGARGGRRGGAPVVLTLATADVTKLPKASDTKDLTFDKDIAPIFKASCVACHATVDAAGAARQATSGLDLTTLQTALKGGAQTNAKDIVPGHADQSLVVLLTGGAFAATTMPPRGTPLTPDQVGLIMAWINQGAK